MPDLFDMLETDYAAGKAGWDWESRESYWRKHMGKTMPSTGGGADRIDWVKDDYVVKLIETPERENWPATPSLVDNPFYHTAEMLTEKYGDPVPNERYWLNESGGKEYASFPEDAKQWVLTFEVIEDGDYKGRWITVYASPRFYQKKDGTWGGKLAAIYLAADPKFDLSQGIEDDLSDLLGKPLRVSAEPKPKDAQYAKVNDWLPVKAGYKAPEETLAAAGIKATPVDDDMADSDIPF